MNLQKLLENHEKWLKNETGGEYANLIGADLFKADLRAADLRGVDLRGADLRAANLRGANLRGADLRGADLRDAKLLDANLRGANLIDADLRGANLRGANLRGADLCDADLSDADISDTDLREADLSGVKLKGSKLPIKNIPIIKNIHQSILDACSTEDALNMSTWHTCQTTHCHAGWVITLAGEQGKLLESIYGCNTAAVLIYMASDPELKKIPNWYASNEDAIKDMKRLAEKA